MFRKSDKYLYWARWIIIIFHILAAVLCIVFAALYFKDDAILNGCLILVGGALSLLISWVFNFLFLSYLWDVKKIRNRLYDENDVMLNRFFDD